ncbi:uncharacterized protein DEA37_0010596 [Paragonimus westermani]|uniref:LysM domain-containing protein n=1 Tax=Paragonimus westermani TaxID=34504 RepID=A0A5J4NU44_9TREM|nr:uncharacterized protein DEA37_0010596 [Paragonimus westermani]
MAETKNSKKKSEDLAVIRREDQADSVESARRKQKTRRRAGRTRLEGIELLSAPTKPLVVKPQRTMEYKVQPDDTLSSVVVRYQSTLSELFQVNRLFCRSLFPGQIIKVPKAIVCEVQRKLVGNLNQVVFGLLTFILKNRRNQISDLI